MQCLRAELARAQANRDHKLVHVTDGGNRLAKTRHRLDAAGLTVAQWRENWACARYRIQAKGSGDEPFGNLTITVSPGREGSLRMPRPLEHLANTTRGRYVLSGPAVFAYRHHQGWRGSPAGSRCSARSATSRAEPGAI